MSVDTLLWTIIEIKPTRAVYVSCNPGILARNLRMHEDVYHRYYETTVGHSTRKIPSFQKNKINVDAFIKPIYTLIKSNIDKLDM